MPEPVCMETGYLTGNGRSLYASFHQPRNCRGAVLFLPPMGEERKCSARLAFEMAEELTQTGLRCLRFDLSGCGESTGCFAESNWSGWLDDARLAWNELTRDLPANSERWILGARLGANLALELSNLYPEITGLILWEPILTGNDLLRDLIRRKQIKEAMGQGAAGSLEDELNAAWSRGEAVDFDGFPISAALRKALAGLDLARQLQSLPPASRLLLCHVGGARTLSGPWAALETTIRAPGQRICCIRQKPFWGLLDYEEAKELKHETTVFLAGDVAAERAPVPESR